MSIGTSFGARFRKHADASLLFVQKWRGNQSGSYVVIFAIMLIPILMAIGGAIDLSQAYLVKQRMNKALDAAGLAVAGMTGLTAAQMQTTAQAYFNANYPTTKLGVPGTVSVSTSGNIVSLNATSSMSTSVMSVVGISTMNIKASSQITKMGKKLEVVLVLDNTGSMSANSKLTTLKTAAKNLITTVSAAAVNVGDVKIAIVPFTTNVNVDPANKNATWLKWTWIYPTQTCKTTGSGSHTTTTCTQDTQTTSKTGWGGCVSDRDQDYDVSAAIPLTSNAATLYPANDDDEDKAGASMNNNCSLQPMIPLSTNWTALNTEIDNMAAGGATNTTIGLVWGWNMLTAGTPLSVAAAPDPTKLNKVIVFLTDGDNTYNRNSYGTCNGSDDCTAVDDRTTLVCNAIKATGIQVYTIRVMDGNDTLLKSCASDPSMYYSVTAASQLTSVFNSIAQALSNLRVSQ